MRYLHAVLARTLLLALLAGAALVGPGAFPAAASTISPGAEASFAIRMNADRAGAGLPALGINAALTDVARAWSVSMAARDLLEHNPALSRQVPSGWSALAENVGFTLVPGYTEAQLVERLHGLFMNSSGHRANVLGSYNQVGIGVAVAASGKVWATMVFAQAPWPHSPPPQPAPDITPQLNEAIAVSRRVFGAGAARFVVLTRGDIFADALGGAGLAGRDAPILFNPGPHATDPDPGLHPATGAEIRRALRPGGKVYVLGGPAAVSNRTAHELAQAGFQVVRLHGAGRVETAVRIAREIRALRGDNGEVLLARADDWADAVTGGAWSAQSGSPVLLTESHRLHPAVAEFLVATRPGRRWALGGTAALHEPVVQTAGATRIWGADRTGTAVAVAAHLWGRNAARSGDQFVVVPAHGDTAWAYALAYAPWSAAHGGPQLLAGAGVPHSVRDYLGGLGYSGGTRGAVQAATPVPPPVVQDLQRLVGG